jgi:hypothetical protein
MPRGKNGSNTEGAKTTLGEDHLGGEKKARRKYMENIIHVRI